MIWAKAALSAKLTPPGSKLGETGLLLPPAPAPPSGMAAPMALKLSSEAMRTSRLSCVIAASFLETLEPASKLDDALPSLVLS